MRISDWSSDVCSSDLPDVAFQRRDVEVAEKDGRLAELFRPARHPFQKRQLLPELGVGLEVGCLAPGGDVDVLEPDSAIEQRADMPRLALVLPVLGGILANRHARKSVGQGKGV